MDRVGHSGQWATPPARFEVDAQTPGIPTLLEPVSDTWLRSRTVVFRWTAVQFGHKGTSSKLGLPSPVHYILAADTWAISIDLWVDTTLQTTDTMAVPWERRYYWKVRAYDNAGNQGLPSPSAAFRVDTTSPPSTALVYPLDSGTVDTNKVTFVWRSVKDNLSGVRYYQLQLADTAFTETLAVTDTVRFDTLPDMTAYYWQVRAVDSAGNVSQWSLRRTFAYRAGIAENQPELGTEVRLLGPAPNPFARTTRLRLVLPRDMPVQAEVYDAAGQLVQVVSDRSQARGVCDLVWDGRDAKNRPAPSGLYFCRLAAGDYRATCKLLITE